MVAAAPLATGAALVVYIVADMSLPVALLFTSAVAAAAVTLVWRRTPVAGRAALKSRARLGLLAGIAATAAYDVTRLVGTEIGGTSISPFDVWHLFGITLVGASAPNWLQWTVGTAFHYANGLGFAVAYVVFVRRPRVWTAVVWAALLNGAMLLLYPPWLGLSPVATEELTWVSILGHIAYGTVLGSVSKALVSRPPHREELRS